jgi:leucine dehydrogenase
MDDLIASWDGEQVLSRHDRESGAWMFISIHSTVLGPAGGGTRIRVYDHPRAALADALRLASGMTRKMAAADLPVGGGKSVIAVRELPAGAERERLLLQYVSLVEALGGRYITGPDMNTNIDDLDVMHRHSRHVFGSRESLQDGRSIAMATAIGTLQGIRSCVAHATGCDSLSGRRVVVQGVGEVGGPLTRMLAEAGADVAVCDVVEDRVTALVERHGVDVVDPARVLEEPCDVFSPCAMGEVIGAEDVDRMGARIVAGCANIQLRTPATGAALRRAGILYGPDYVVNSGGAIHAFGVESLGWDSERVLAHIRGIDDRLQRIFRIADEEDISTAAAAERIVQEKLRAAATRAL